MRFFFDRNMSKVLARLIDVFDRSNTIQALDDDGRFAKNTPDVEWIRILAADGSEDAPAWVIISFDGRILKSKAELSALREAKLTFFCLSNQWMSMKFEEQAWRLVKVWPDIVENAKSTRPQIFEVSGSAGMKIQRRTF
jgi:hypothetical protein